MDEAMNIFKQMQMDGVQPNVVAYTTILDGLCKIRRVEDVRNLMNQMARQGISPDIVTYNSLISGFFRLGNWKRSDGDAKENDGSRDFSRCRDIQHIDQCSLHGKNGD